MTAALTDRQSVEVPHARAHPFHIGRAPRHAHRPGRAPAAFSQAVRRRHDLPGGRHRRFLESAARPPLGADAQRRGAEADARACARAPASSTSPATTTSACATISGCSSAASRSGATSCTPRRAGGATWCCTATSSTSSCAPPSGWRLLGDRGYELALWLNNPLNWVRRHLGLGYWSLSGYLKYRVKSAVSFIGAFEEAVATEAGAPRRRRRHLRPHPSPRRPQDRRNALPQLRRLGRELHGHRRDARRPAARRAPPARSRPRRLTPAWPSPAMPEFRVSEISSTRPRQARRQ